MSNFNIRINGAANLSQAKAEFAKLTAVVESLNAAMEQSVVIQGAVNPEGYARMAQAVKVNSAVTRNAALSTGMFEVQQLKLNSATEEYTKLMQKQKLSFRELYQDRKRGLELARAENAANKAAGIEAKKRTAFEKSVAGAAYREQMALRQMVVQEMPGTVGGKKIYDVFIPNEVHESWNKLRDRIGFVREELRAASTQMINWGKNTQWAGRQLMVGFTMPVAAFGAATGVLQYQVDKELTRIQKVYDTTARVVAGDNNSMIAVEQELARVRVDSLNTARNAATQYGQSVQDTLKVQADLAATGLKGFGLQDATLQTMRISTLGELDTSQSINMTIALQSAFRDTIKTSEDLTNAFNFMNATENATSLSIQDIAEALPRAGSAMAALGVSVQEMTVLMTSMKEAGVDAAEGANALKSATGTILKPSPAADKFIKQISDGKVQVMELAEASGGNLYKALQILFQQMKDAGMGSTQQQQTLVALFGKYQYNRMAGILNNFGGAINGVQNQTAKAMELMGEDWGTLGDIADGEISRIQNSLAGRFKSTLEAVKIELAEMGKPFLEIGVSILGGVEKIISAFNAMPAAAKKAFAITAIGAAILGPLVMLTGLTANFGGNLIKMGVSVLRVATDFKLLNKESQAATLAAELAKKGFVSEAEALQMLTTEMRAMTQAAQEGALAQKAMMLAANSAQQVINGQSVGRVPVIPDRIFQGTNMPLSQYSTTPMNLGNLVSAPAGYVRPPSLPEKGRSYTNLTGQVPAPIVSPEDVKNSEKMSNWMKTAAVSGSVLSAAMLATMVSSNGTVDSIAKWAMYASLAAPAFTGIAAAMKRVPWAGIGSILGTTMTAGATAVNSAFTAIKTEAALTMTGLGRNVGLLGKMKNEAILTATGMGRIQQGAVAAGRGLKTGLASIMGMISPIGWVGVGLAAAAASAYLIYKNNQKAREEVENMYSDAQALSQILGYTPSEMQTSVNKAGESVVTMTSKVRKFREEYAGVTSSIRDAGDVQEKFNRAMSQGIKVIQTGGTAEQAKEAVEIALRAAETKAGEAEAIMLRFKAQMDFTNVDNYVEQLLGQVATITDDAKYKEMSGMDKFIFGEPRVFAGEGVQNIMDSLSLNPGTDEYNRVVASMTEAGKSASTAFDTAFNNGLSTAPVEQAIQQTLDVLNEGVESADSAWDKHVAIDKREAFISSLVKGRVDDEKQYAENLSLSATAADLLGGAHMFISEETEDTAASSRAYASGMGMAGGAVQKAAAATRVLNREMEALAAVDWVGAYKGAMSDTQDSLASIASDNFTNTMNSAMDAFRSQQESRMDALQNAQERAANAMENRHEREQDAFEKRWERRKSAVEDAFDARINKVDEAIKAEEKAEEIRQRIFDAEIQRIQRLAEMANTNIDFNIAINSGNLDEAAKIRNDMQAQETEWALGDAGDKASRASERRTNRMERKQDHLEKLKDKRLEAIDAAEDAERKSLERRQEREKAFLDRQQAMNEAALQTEIDNNIAAQEEIWNSRKENLDRAIELFKAYVPKNERDLREHVARISDKYEEFNVTTKGKFNKTAVNIGDMLQSNVKDAANAIRDEIAWAGIGDKVATDMIRGAFGMTPAQFQEWLVTGKWPKGADITAPDYYRSSTEDTPRGFDSYHHTGGIIGVDKGGRRGRSGGLKRDEIPSVLQAGEGVLSKKAMASLTRNEFKALNDGYGFGGGSAGLGFAGIMGAMMYRAVTNTLGISAMNGAVKRGKMDAKKAGRAKGKGGVTNNLGGFISGGGGWRKPSVPGKGWVNTHDYRNGLGSPLYAVSDGVIVDSRAITSGGSPGNGLYSTPYRSYGETIAMRAASGDIFRYAHLSPGQRYVRAGQTVKGGSLIGRSGMTGNASGPHTHFDVNGNYNASGWLAAKGVSLSKGAQNIRWDNTIANLHKGEAVLTEDINKQFREGVKRFADGPNSSYNLYMTVNGSNVDEDALVNKTMTAFRRMEMRRPQSRSGK